MRPFGAVTAAHRHHEPYDLAPSLEPRVGKGSRDEVREQRVRRYDNIGPGDEYGCQEFGPAREELAQGPQVIRREHGEAGER